MYSGYVFVCDAAAVKDCMKRRLFTCSEENVQTVRSVEAGSIVFFLNLGSDILVGPFTAESYGGLKPGSWREYTEEQTNAAIRVTWEKLHELRNAQERFPFLKEMGTCKLKHFQTQDLMDALEEAPLAKTE